MSYTFSHQLLCGLLSCALALSSVPVSTAWAGMISSSAIRAKAARQDFDERLEHDLQAATASSPDAPRVTGQPFPTSLGPVAAEPSGEAPMSPSGVIRAEYAPHLHHVFMSHASGLIAGLRLLERRDGGVWNSGVVGDEVKRLNQLMRTDGAPPAILISAKRLKKLLEGVRPKLSGIPQVDKRDRELLQALTDDIRLVGRATELWSELLSEPGRFVRLMDAVDVIQGAIAHTDLILRSRRSSTPIHLQSAIDQGTGDVARFPRDLLIHVGLGMHVCVMQRMYGVQGPERNLIFRASSDPQSLFLTVETDRPDVLLVEELGEEELLRAIGELIAPYGGTVREEGENRSRVVVTLPLPPAIAPPPAEALRPEADSVPMTTPPSLPDPGAGVLSTPPLGGTPLPSRLTLAASDSAA